MGCEMDYWKAKAIRARHYYRFVFGWVLEDCGACGGSGIYDNTGSPPCDNCSGTGKSRVRGPKWREGLFAECCPELKELLDG